MNRFISLVKAIVFVLLITLLVDCARKEAGEFFIQIKGGNDESIKEESRESK